MAPRTVAVLVLALASLGACVPSAPQADRFRETTVLSDLVHPTAFAFSPDGRIFVAEQSGLVKVFAGLEDPTASVFADLRTEVHAYWDRGLLGLALDPAFPAQPHVYVLYTRDASVGGTAPAWGTPGQTSDGCPTPPGPLDRGCVVSGRLSRLTAAGDVATGVEDVLLDGWCQQFPGHSVADVTFGPDGALYVSAGDGASFTYADWGQAGNPCGDPPGGTMRPPDAEGGSLRAQDLRTAGDPVGLSGTILRLDPDTGAARADNPSASDPDPAARRIVAHGLRNPFRMTFRPGTSELYVGDVGGARTEEIDRLDLPGTSVSNFGWPCYEGTAREPTFDGADLRLCEGLYADGPAAVVPPIFEYPRAGKTLAGDPCRTGTASVSGLAFYEGGSFPDVYDGALFFTDYARDCAWVLMAGADGRPDPDRAYYFRAIDNPVDLHVGPGGDLYYLDFLGGRLQRISHSPDRPPVADVAATPASGPAPLTVRLDGSGSRDPDGDALTYAWDLDGDGQLDDGTGPTASWTYDRPGVVQVQLRVTDQGGNESIAGQSILVAQAAPEAVIDQPRSDLRWRVGDTIAFAGRGLDLDDGPLPAPQLSWELVMHHCPAPDACHEHTIQTLEGVASGSFVAPDHEYPSHFELRLTARDASGLEHTTDVLLEPQTTELTVATSPPGIPVGVGEASVGTPTTKTVIVGSHLQVSAPATAQVGDVTYRFASWDDGGEATHAVTVPDRPIALEARYVPS